LEAEPLPGAPGTRRRTTGENGRVNEEHDDERTPVGRETDFGSARLLPDVDRPHGWLLTVDGAPQSYVDVRDPEYLEFEYVRRLAFAVDAAAPAGQPLDVLHLGGGGLTLPRYVAATRPGSRQEVVEADRALAGLVAEYLPPPPEYGITVCVADARDRLAEVAPGSADLLIADVFGGSRVPAHLTSVEYLTLAARAVRPSGLYLANLADGAPFAFLRPQIATVASAFEHVCLIAEPGMLRGRRFGNAVVVAGRRELPLAALARRAASDAFPARVEHGDGLRALAAGACPVRDADAVPSPDPPEGAFGVG
jgi:spermidine synthase